MNQELEKLLQLNIHTRRRKPGEEALEAKLKSLHKLVTESDPFINYIIHHEGKLVLCLLHIV